MASVAREMVEKAGLNVDELIPASHEYDEGNYAILGAIAGMAVMAFSLWLL